MLVYVIISDDDGTVIYKVYEKHYRKMLYTATQILGASRAEDAVHDVFVKMIERNGEKIFEDLCNKPGLFFVIMVKNHSINLLKKEKDTLPLLFEDNEDEDIFTQPAADAETQVIEKEAADKLASLIRRMKPSMRRLLEYRYICEFSNKEIAEILGEPQTNVAVKISRAKDKLREMMEREARDDVN